MPAAVERFFAAMEQAGLDAELLISEAAEWEARMRDLAPHMLAEMQATGEAAGLDAARFLAYCGLKYCRPDRTYTAEEWLEPLGECTSFMSTGGASGLPANLLHKNRDAARVAQSVHIKQVAGKQRVLGAGDVGDLGLCHALNGAGLAAKTNTGDAIAIPLRRTICNTMVLRHLAEECATCEQALERLRELARGRLISNGTNGCIWLFVDREVGLIVEETPTRIAWRFVADDVDARQNEFQLPEMGGPAAPTKRYTTALSRMRELAGRVRPEDLNDLGRSGLNYSVAICHDTTNSATTSVIPANSELPPYWEMAVGHPNNTLYLPMSPWAPGLPVGLVDGSFWDWSARLHPHNKGGENPPLDFESHEGAFRWRSAQAATPDELAQATASAVVEAEMLLQKAVETLWP